MQYRACQDELTREVTIEYETGEGDAVQREIERLVVGAREVALDEITTDGDRRVRRVRIVYAFQHGEIEEIEDVAPVASTPTASTAPVPPAPADRGKTIARVIIPRAYYSLALTLSAVLMMIAAAFAVMRPASVDRAVATLGYILAATVVFLLACSALIYAGSKQLAHGDRSDSPRRIKFALPLLGAASTFAVAAAIARDVGDPTVRTIGLAFGIANAVAFFARMLEDTHAVLAAVEPGHVVPRLDATIIRHHRAASANVCKYGSVLVAWATFHQPHPTGAVIAFTALAATWTARWVADVLRLGRDPAVRVPIIDT